MLCALNKAVYMFEWCLTAKDDSEINLFVKEIYKNRRTMSDYVRYYQKRQVSKSFINTSKTAHLNKLLNNHKKTSDE